MRPQIHTQTAAQPRYEAPLDDWTTTQLSALRDHSPELFKCCECGIDMIVPDLICGFCAVELGGEGEPTPFKHDHRDADERNRERDRQAVQRDKNQRKWAKTKAKRAAEQSI